MRKTICPMFCCVLLLLGAATATAACVDYATAVDPQPVSTIPVYPYTWDEGGWHVEGHLLYTVINDDLTIHDTSNPASPVLLGTYTFAGGFDIVDVYVEGDYAFVSSSFDDGSGPNDYLMVVDVSNPQNPTLAGQSGSLGVYGKLNRIVVAKGYAWVITEFYVVLFDVRNAPSVVFLSDATYTGPSGGYHLFNSLETDGEYVYATVHYTDSPCGRLLVFDAVPASTQYSVDPVAQFTDFGPCNLQTSDPGAKFMTLSEGAAFVSTEDGVGSNTIAVVDLSDPANPVRIGCIQIPIDGVYIFSMYARDSFLYILTSDLVSNFCVRVYDINDTSNITLTGQFDLSTWGFQLAVTQDALLVGTNPTQVFERQCDAPTIVAGSVGTGLYPAAGGNVDWTFTWKTEHWTDPALDKVVINCTSNPLGQCAFDPGTTRTGGTCVETAGGWLHTLRFNAGQCVTGCSYTYTVSSTRTGIETVSGTHYKKIKTCPAPSGFSEQAPALGMKIEAAPNPFNPMTKIRFHIPSGAVNARMSIFDVRGREIVVLHDGSAAEGWREYMWNGCDATGAPQASGVYFAMLVVDGRSLVHKLAMLK